MPKIAKSINDQITHLQNNKNIVFDTNNITMQEDFLLAHNYINVISPFKEKYAKKDSQGSVIKNNNKHIYENPVPFDYYIDDYNNEKKDYQIIYENIRKLESCLNAVTSYHFCIFYNVDDTFKISQIIPDLINNIQNRNFIKKQENIIKKKINMLQSHELNYANIYLSLDRLNFGDLLNLYKALDSQLRQDIFNDIARINKSFILGAQNSDQFEYILFRIVHIRNIISHNNSISIHLKYFNIKNNEYRKSKDRKKIENLIKKLKIP